MTPWVFGIDGGGTSSRIKAEAADGTLVYSGTGNATNLNAVPAPVVRGVIESLLRGAFDSGLSPTECLAGHIGSAGVDSEADRVTMNDILQLAFASAAALHRSDTPSIPGAGRTGGQTNGGTVLPRLSASNDAEPALVGALDDTEGYLLIAGTGSIAMGMTKTGVRVRAGGWGHVLGDEGSAYWIAMEGIQRGLRSAELRDAPGGLLEAGLRHFGLASATGFIDLAYNRFDKAHIASFAPVVLELARQGDVPAGEIVRNATHELVGLVVSVHSRLAPDIERQRLALYGGLLTGSQAMHDAVRSGVAKALPDMIIVEPAGDAAHGACRMARAAY